MGMSEKLFWPIIGRGWLFGLAANLIIAAVLVFFFSPNDDDRALQIGAVILVIVVVENLVAIKNWLVKSLWLVWFGKRYAETFVLDTLRAAKLPPPGDYDWRNFEYLNYLSDDPEALPEDRVKAARIYSGLKAQWNVLGITRGAILAVVADDAFTKWANEAPKRRPSATAS